MFGIHLVDPVILPHSQEHGVLIPDLLEPGVALNHGAVALGDDAGDGGEGGVIHHREDHPVHVLLPDYSLDSLVTGDKKSLLNISINELSFVSSRQKHVTVLRHPQVPLPCVSADPLYPQCEAVRDVVCTVRRMTGAGEQVLASISFLPIKIRIDLTSTDTEGGVKEGDGVLGGAGAVV